MPRWPRRCSRPAPIRWSHLALLYNPIHNASYAHEVEAIGTLQLLGAVTAAGVDALVALSSTALYGASPDNPNFLTEDRPLKPAPQSRFLADKLEVERQFQSFREKRPGIAVAVLRMAPLLGPRVRNPVTQLLGRPIVPVLLGRDPLMQFLHEDDAVGALELAVMRRANGTYNIAPPGALPLSSVLKLLGRTPLPLPGPVARAGMAALWSAIGFGTPPSWLDYLRYLWVADGSLAERELGMTYHHNCARPCWLSADSPAASSRAGRRGDRDGSSKRPGTILSSAARPFGQSLTRRSLRSHLRRQSERRRWRRYR